MGPGWDQPKPLLEIGGRPILEHIMDIYLDAGVDEFVVCAGYRFDDFVKWFSSGDPPLRATAGPELRFTLQREDRALSLILANTGVATMTGGRLRRVKSHLTEPFYLTYADGLADVNLETLRQTHRSSGASVTVTAIPFAVRYGVITLAPGNDLASRFEEKPILEGLWRSGGFFVVDPGVVPDYCVSDNVSWEADVMNKLAAAGNLAVYRHSGYWASIDYPSQLYTLREAWSESGALWRVRGGEPRDRQGY